MADLKPGVTLVTGGGRSGKSTYAQQLAIESGAPVVYLATGVPVDDEMRERIARHRGQRPSGWRTVEEPLRLAATIRDNCEPGDCVVFDCLTTWLGNLLHQRSNDPDAEKLRSAAVGEIGALLDVRSELQLNLIVVSNEVGWGIVPADPASRMYRDLLGELNQKVARDADTVCLMVAGIPLRVQEAPV